MTPSQRHRFAVPDDVHYINCAYMSPLLDSVREAGIDGIDVKRAPWRIATDTFYEPLDEIRRLAARLVGAPAANVAISPAVSYGVAIAANATQLRREQNVVLPDEEFPSVVYAWRERCKAAGAELRLVPRPERPEGQGAAWNRRLLEAIDSRTAVVSLSSVHWTDGTVFDLEAIGVRAREVDATYIVDGTQSVGALPFDFAAVRPDLLVCAGYKWLMGPYGMGVAVFGERLMDAAPLEFNWIARKDSRDFSNLVNYTDEFQPGACRFDVGERSNFVLVPMLTAALRQVLAWGTESIQAHCGRLAERLEGLLSDTPLRMSTPPDSAGHLFGITGFDVGSLDAVQAVLARRNVFVSVRGGTVRVSPHLYNNDADIDSLAGALIDS